MTHDIKPIRTAVFPVAGLGTRFLPATKAIPKEMLTLLDRPLIHHAVEEARAAGIEKFVFVIGNGKDALVRHFDEARPLLDYLWRHNVREEFSCRLRWSPGTFVIWDNRSCLHKAFNDYDGYRREMSRTIVDGEVPA